MNNESHWPLATVSDSAFVVHQQYDASADFVDKRWVLYEAAQEPLDPTALLTRWMLEHGEGWPAKPVLDIGGGRHIPHARALRRFGYDGPLIVVDPALALDEPQVHNYAAPHPFTGNAITLIPSTFENTFFEPRSMGVVMWIMAAYHAPNVEAAMRRVQQTMCDDGILLVATSGQHNKPLHRFCQEQLGGALHVKPPPPYNASFTTEIAASMLRRYFDVKEEYVQDSRVLITEHTLPLLERSLMSRFNTYRPSPDPAELENAITKIIRPMLLEMMEHGGVEERIMRSFYACTLKQPNTGAI